MKIPCLSQHTFVLWLKKCLLCMLVCFVITANCFAANRDAELSKKLHAIEKKSNTIMGITAIHIEKNKTVALNSKQLFFMASTIKLPIAIAFLHLVDEKKESLNRKIKLDSKNSVPGSGSLHYLFARKKIQMSLHQILKYMLVHSDNSASDIILQKANGPKSVTKRMNELGFKNISINRSILDMFLATNPVDRSIVSDRRASGSLEKEFNRIPLKKKMLAWQRFENDVRDTTTSEDMAKLLVKIYKREALSESSTNVLLKIMEGCRTGRSRIKGLLPASVKVAHKTGTWAIYERDYLRYPGSKKLYRFVSDVGIITLPNKKGHIAIAIYVKSRAASDYSRSRAVALASKAIYDHFMTQ